MKKILCLLGPTTTGKTDMGIFLAKKLSGEIVACDSRQVYCGLDIGTGKLPGFRVKHGMTVRKNNGFWEIDGVKIWMYDVCNLSQQYTAADYVKDATKLIDDILNRGKLPIIVGGTGFYLKALLEGIPNLNISVDKKLRKKLEKLSVADLQAKLKALSPTKWNEMSNSDKQNPRRLLRAIEISMNPYVESAQSSIFKQKSYDVLKIGLTAPRDQLYKSVDLRVFNWINQGIIEEVKNLNQKGVSLDRFKKLGLEYRIIADFLDGKVKDINLIKTIQLNIHGYVRRQQTWFKKEENVNWFDITTADYYPQVEKLISAWYNQPNAKKN